MKGKGISLYLSKCKRDITMRKRKIAGFLQQVVHLIGMKPLGEPVFRKGSKHLPGLTGVQIIETSHITFHCFKEDIGYLFDVVSCKDFDEDKLMRFMREYFRPKRFKINALYEIRN